MLNRADMGTKAIARATTATGGGSPKPGNRAITIQPVIPTLTRFSTAVIMLKSIIVSNLPTTISLRCAGLQSSVSKVPRSFSPAHRSTAG